MHDNLEGSGFIHICAFLFPPLELTAHRNLQKYPNCRAYFAMHGFHPSHIAADLRISAERGERVSGKRKGEVTTDSDAWISRGRKRQLSILVVSLSTIFVLLFFGLLLIFFGCTVSEKTDAAFLVIFHRFGAQICIAQS